MKQEFKILYQTRQNIMSTIEGLTTDQLNKIPEGFNNNIAWNFCHILLVQQLLTYGLCNLKIDTPKEIISLFKKGATPDKYINEDVMGYFKNNYLSSVDLLASDYKNGIFENFKAYESSYGYTLREIEDAIKFNNVHEGFHFGYIVSMKHLVVEF